MQSLAYLHGYQIMKINTGQRFPSLPLHFVLMNLLTMNCHRALPKAGLSRQYAAALHRISEAQQTLRHHSNQHHTEKKLNLGMKSTP